MPNEKLKIYIEGHINDFKRHFSTTYTDDVEVNNAIIPKYKPDEYDLYIIVPKLTANGLEDFEEEFEKLRSGGITQDKIIILLPVAKDKVETLRYKKIEKYLNDKGIEWDDLNYHYDRNVNKNIFKKNDFLDGKIENIKKEKAYSVGENKSPKTQPLTESKPQQPKTDLQLELNTYKKNRESRMGNFLRAKWFPWGSDSSKSKEIKLEAAKKVIENNISGLTKKEIKALQDGTLGKIIEKDKNLSQDLKDRLKDLKGEKSQNKESSSNFKM